MNSETEKTINRILVSLDFDSSSSSFVESMVKLASQLDAELCGLFIEDSELQQVANLPFSREITFPLAHTRELNSDQIARHLKQHAEAMREMMKNLSQLSNVACSFKTAKGPRIESVLSESYDFQVVVLLPEKYSSLTAKRPARLEEIINPTVLLYDGSEQAQKSAYIVKALADKGELHQLKILTLDYDSEVLAKQRFTFENVNIDYQRINAYEISSIIALLETQKTGLLILPAEDKLIEQSEQIRKILDALKCPLLLVR
ncbi:MAG: hypothetical protein KAJ92_03995 [Gammaproteobacteria bacterium]|nr:hypothetical protein [Gammaproteobacteria bacterium]MCK5262818.1 hypothetical protein [Gammaproteobacteria bacterium]